MLRLASSWLRPPSSSRRRLRRRRCVVVVKLQGSAPNRNCQPTPRREIVNPIVNPIPAPRRRRVAARGCCDAPVMRLCAAPRCRVVVVAPSSSRRAWQHLAGNIWRGLAGNIWLATFGWQHLAGNIWRGLAGNIWLRVRSSSPRRRLVVLSSPSSWVSQGEARVRVRPGQLQRLGTWEAERFWASVSAAATAWGLQRL